MDEIKTPEEDNAPVDIVLAEDDPFISRMYQIKLAGTGYKVASADNGRVAAELIRAKTPRLVLIDINMPELSGFEVIESLKSGSYNFDHTAVVFLTNSNRKEDVERAKKLGGEYLIKADLTPKSVLELIDSKIKK